MAIKKHEQVTEEEFAEILAAPKKKKVIKLKIKNPPTPPAPAPASQKLAVKKLVDDVKKEIKTPVVNVLNIKTPDIDYTIKETTRYDINWFYLKEKFIRFKRWCFTPYTRYTVWFNRIFNTPKKEPVSQKVSDTVIIHQKKKVDRPEIYRSEK